MNRLRFVSVALAAALAPPAVALTADFPICGSGKRFTCVVDGDAVWVEGVKYRLEEIDMREKGERSECMQEGLQGPDGPMACQP